MNPRLRTDLTAPSKAVELVKGRLKTPARVCGLGETLNPGYAPVIGLEAIAGSDPLFNPFLRELMTAEKVRMSDELWAVEVELSTFSALSPLWRMLNVGYYFHEPQNRQTAGIEGLHSIGSADLEVLEDSAAWPRAFFIDEVVSYRDVSEFAAILSKSDGRPFAAIQNAAPAVLPSAERLISPAYDYQLGVNDTSFEVDAPKPGVVVLTEAFEPESFVATVDGKEMPYYRINHAFKGVEIGTAGKHRVVFSYRPRYWNLTVVLCASGVALALVSLLFGIRSRRESQLICSVTKPKEEASTARG